MPLYEVTTKEVYEVTYQIEAGSPDEALEAIHTGDYLSRNGGVQPELVFDSVLKDETIIRRVEQA